MESAAELKVKAFLYTLVTYAPLFFVGAIAVFLGNLALSIFKHDLFTIFIAVSLVIFGGSLVIVALLEPLIKLFYFSEAANNPISGKNLDVSANSNKTAVGVNVEPSYDIKQIANEIIANECQLIGEKYCLTVAKHSGLNVDEKGKLLSVGNDIFSDLEKLIDAYAKAFGRPAIYAAEVVLAKHPDLKFKTLYK